MNSNELASEERSLMNTYRKLNDRIESLSELSIISGVLIDKLKRTENKPIPNYINEDMKKNDVVEVGDIISLFDEINDNIAYYIETIKSNIHKANLMIG